MSIQDPTYAEISEVIEDLYLGMAPQYDAELIERAIRYFVRLRQSKESKRGLVGLHDFLLDHPQVVQIDYEDSYEDDSAEEDAPVAIAYYRVWWREERPDWLDEEDE